MKTKIEIKSVFGKLLFEYESENNTIKKTLEKAISSYADLRYADLRSADLRSADLRSTDLRYAKNIDEHKYLIQIIPEEGSFTAYKKASGCIVKIEIPKRARRTCNFLNRKCRASMVKTLSITNSKGEQLKEVCGDYKQTTIYKIGRLTKADKFDDTLFNDCTNGIHFFVTKQEAKNW